MREITTCVKENLSDEMEEKRRQRVMLRCREEIRGKYEREVQEMIDRVYDEVAEKRKY